MGWFTSRDGIRALTAAQTAFVTSGSSARIMMPPPVGGVFFALGIKPEITPQLVDFPTYPRTL